MSNDQDALPAEGMPDAPGQPTRITFVGMHAESHATGVFKLGDDHQFKVGGRITSVGEEVMADGHRRNVVKVDVSSGGITPLSYNEPTPPSPVEDISPDGDRDDIGND